MRLLYCRVVGLLHVSQIVSLLFDAQAFPGAEDLAASGTDGQRIGDARSKRRYTKIQQHIVPVGFEFRIYISLLHRRSKLSQMIGNRIQTLAESVDVLEPLHVLTVTLLVWGG